MTSFYRGMGKRALDAAIAGVALAALSPILAIIAVVVRSALGSPVLFSQARPGLNAEPFLLTKFRTMTEASDEAGRPLPDEARLTRIGSFLRRWSLDELPEFWNVLRGDMSVVGPRPLLMQYLGRYTAEQARRHEVRPGITGWAQVNGRDLLTWPERFAMDVWYVDHLSFALDIRILALTIWKIVRREGVLQSGRATKEEFLG